MEIPAAQTTELSPHTHSPIGPTVLPTAYRTEPPARLQGRKGRRNAALRHRYSLLGVSLFLRTNLTPTGQAPVGSVAPPAHDQHRGAHALRLWPPQKRRAALRAGLPLLGTAQRSEEHTSELQSRQYLVCRLLLEK